MAAVGMKSESKAGGEQTEEGARTEEGAVKKKASLLNKILYYLLQYFSALVSVIIGLVAGYAFVVIRRGIVEILLISSFKKELRKFLKIQFFLRKLLIYNENDKYEKEAKDVVKEFIEENGRVLFLPNVECKKKGLRHLIEIVKEHYSTEIEDRARYLDDSGSILKKGLMLIVVTLAFACCLPFLAIGFIGIGIVIALRYFPDKLRRNSSIFKDIRDEEIESDCNKGKEKIISIWHTSLVSELLVNVGLIDKLAEIRHKAYKNCTMLEGVSFQKAAEMQIRQYESDFVDEILVQKVIPLEEGNEARKKLTNTIITTDGRAPCQFACCCTGWDGMQA